MSRFDPWGHPLRSSRRQDGLAPFSHERLYGDEKYSLQGMVLNAVNAPA